MQPSPARTAELPGFVAHQLFSVRQVADYLMISHQKVHELIRSGELNAYRFGPKKFKISDIALKEFLEKKKFNPARSAAQKSDEATADSAAFAYIKIS